MKPAIKVQCFYKDERRTESIITSPTQLDGATYTEIQMQAKLRSRKDIDKMIEFLKVSKQCFREVVKEEAFI